MTIGNAKAKGLQIAAEKSPSLTQCAPPTQAPSGSDGGSGGGGDTGGDDGEIIIIS
jgi:hypothetical protein